MRHDNYTTPEAMREAIADLVHIEPEALHESLGGIVVTTSDEARNALVQARKRAFDRWFEGSVIVDSEGKPLQVLHGTRNDFSVFRSMERYPSKKLYLNGVAVPKADGWDMGDDRKGVPEGIHYSAWVDALTLGPKEGLAFREAEHARYGGNDPDTLRHLADLKRLVEGQVEWRDEVHPTGDGFYFSPSATYSMAFSGGRNNNLEEGGNLMPVYLSIKNPIYLDAGAIEVAGIAHNVERYKTAGYDGAIYVPEKMFGGTQPLEMDLGSQSAQIVAFYPEQIKGVFNRGTFDPANPDILHSLVEEEVAGGTSLSALRANAVAARQSYELFERSLRNGQEPDFDTYIRLSEARSTSESALATALQALPDDGFALQAKTPDGRMLMLTRSAQKAGHYQLTRFDRTGVPWGDTQYPTKAQATAIFIDEADVATVIDAEGILNAAHGEEVTRDAAFAAWFGDSKVVDASGKPLLVYHGTDSVFAEFSRTGDIGYHFGTEIAARDRAARVGGAGVLVEPVTLSQVEKDSLAALNGEIGGTPDADLYALLLRKLDSPRHDLRAQVEAMPADEIKQVEAEYLEQPDSIRFAERVDRAKAGEGFRVEVNGETVSMHRTVREANARAARLREQAAKPMALYLRIENPIRLPDLGVWPAQEIAKEAGFSKQEMEQVVEAGAAEQQYAAVRAILEAKGFDGIVYRNEVEHAGEDSYIAFRPEQIKSATANRGTFDPQDPNILHSLAEADAQSQAWHDRATNTTYLIADRIPAGREASVFLHEIVHRHGRAVLPEQRFAHLVDQVKAWGDYDQGSSERAIHDAAQRRVATARVTGAAADEELFAYAVEEAVARGVQPSAAAVKGSAEQWLQAVVQSIQRVGEKLIGNDLQGLDGQDLVDLAYALAQMDSPEHGLEVRKAVESLKERDVEVSVSEIHGAELVSTHDGWSR